MLTQSILEALQGKLSLGDVSYFQEISSTNEMAKTWLDRGCPDLSIIAANSQTQGKGRSGRRWFTNPGSSLAISLILTHKIPPMELIGGIASISIHDAISNLLEKNSDLKVKWPNDILVSGRKICGILIEGHWIGDDLRGVIVGIGLNITTHSLSPDQPVRFPATYLDAHTLKTIDHGKLLEDILRRFMYWRLEENIPLVLNEWNQRLAYKGKRIRAIQNDQNFSEGELLRIAPDGRLVLKTADHQIIHFNANEVQIIPEEDVQDDPTST